MKSVLSLLINKNKLQLIKYSKYLQNKIEITIEDFKKESGRYFIGDKNGLGKEFDIVTNTQSPIPNPQWLRLKKYLKYNKINKPINY